MPTDPGERVWIDYVRAGQTLSIAYQQCDARLTAELLEPTGELRVIAVEHFLMPRTRGDVMLTIKEFAAAVIEYFAEGRRP